MTYAIVIAWWPLGICGALLARYFLTNGESISRGGLVICCATGLSGPITWALAAVWGLCFLFDKPATDPIRRWWNTPLRRK